MSVQLCEHSTQNPCGFLLVSGARGCSLILMIACERGIGFPGNYSITLRCVWIVKLRLSRGLFNTRVRGSGFTHTVYNATVCGEFHTQIAHYNAHTLDGIKGVSLWPFLMCIFEFV